MSEPHIRYGLDPRGHYVDIEEALERPHYYRCPVCEDFLQVRHGEERIWYFAHIKSYDDSPECSLRTQIGLDEWVKTVKRSPIERDQEAKKLQLWVIVNPYTDILDLYAAIPTPDWDDFPQIELLEETIKSICVTGKCIEKGVSQDSFHPREAQVIIPLNPESKSYEININSSPMIKSLTGTWSAMNIEQDNLFVGDSFRAIRVERNYRIKQGDTVFIILQNQLDTPPPLARIYKLGPFTVLSFEISDETDQLIGNYLSQVEFDSNAFYVDVILPSYADPYPITPVDGKADSTSLIAIIPPKDLDPSFEVVSVPLEKEKEVILPCIGTGTPRFYCPTFPSNGTRRLSIHWGGRHNYLQLHALSKDQTPTLEELIKEETKIGIRLISHTNETEIIVPWTQVSYDPIECIRPQNRDEGIGFEFIAPSNLNVDIQGHFIDSNSVSNLIRELDIAINDAIPIIISWIESGCDRLDISFGALGNVFIKYQQTQKMILEISDELIEKRLHEMGDELPKKANWSLIKKVLGVDDSICHYKIPGGTKKRFRRILMRVRGSKYGKDNNT